MFEEIKENWQKIKEYIRDDNNLTDVSYNTWILPLEFHSVEDNTVRIVFTGIYDSFPINYVTRKYTLPFQAVIEEVTGYQLNVEFVPEQRNKNNISFGPRDAGKRIIPASESAILEASLNPRYTFDTFVVGANNKFAHAASLSVAESPGTEYNPLFIYGGPGLGKTHLMQAIAHFILKNSQKLKILYVSSEVFTNEVIDSIRNKTQSQLKNKYRNIDVLLIDDIQFIIGKESTQEEFFNTFNYLYENGKQIVLSSDQSPKSFTTLDERLISRFEWGLTVDISAPDYETRMAILRKKEETEGYTIDNEILQYITSNIKTNIRELEGALTKMYAYQKLHPDVPLTLDIAKENLKDIINPEKEKNITPENVINVVAEYFGVRPEDIKSQKRNKEIVLPRQISMYLIRILNDISLKDVGNVLGGRDHTTVIYGYKTILKEMQVNKELENTIEMLKRKLLNG